MNATNNLFKGRMGRGKYFFLSVIGTLATASTTYSLMNGEFSVKMIPIIILSNIFFYVITVKRLHDIGYRGTLALLVLVPLANEIFVLYLILKRGQYGENLYGSDPRM